MSQIHALSIVDSIRCCRRQYVAVASLRLFVLVFVCATLFRQYPIHACYVCIHSSMYPCGGTVIMKRKSRIHIHAYTHTNTISRCLPFKHLNEWHSIECDVRIDRQTHTHTCICCICGPTRQRQKRLDLNEACTIHNLTHVKTWKWKKKQQLTHIVRYERMCMYSVRAYIAIHSLTLAHNDDDDDTEKNPINIHVSRFQHTCFMDSRYF